MPTTTKPSSKETYRTFIELDPYEAKLLNKLWRDLKSQAQQRGKRVQDKKALICACIRTAIHTVYGEDYLHEELLSAERFRDLMGAANMGPEDDLD